MIRTTIGLIGLFAIIAAACVAFGAYFSYITLQTAHRKTVEAGFGITAERIATTAQFAASLGIALPAQTTLAGLLRRESDLEDAVRTLDVTDRDGTVLFSSDPARTGLREAPGLPDAVSRPIENDLAAAIGYVVVRYDPAAMATGAAALSEDLRFIALPTLLGAALATIVIGLLLAADLKRAVRRAADPVTWPPAARAAWASVQTAHGLTPASAARSPAALPEISRP